MNKYFVSVKARPSDTQTIPSFIVILSKISIHTERIHMECSDKMFSRKHDIKYRLPLLMIQIHLENIAVS
jgi:hypothetical protein